ncbi:DinB family protein [uncultured Allomuricauda sp.]|uniref:DinB family protein n=1 Tax=Flagellimonas sp. W118 TaxID=3410791 RepID=UPI00260D723E|nr:DinB family protein [uncultured Allomuricauda sp.]
MKKSILFSLTLIFTFSMHAQNEELPYHQIPEYPENYSPGNVVARMIDGLGFRYHWATKGLTEKDLTYKPSEDGRNIMETLFHIYGMSEMIKNAPTATPNVRPMDISELTYEDLRKGTLKNLQAASQAMADKNAADFEDFKVIFQRGEKQTPYPYWNMLNGMLSDCIYHTGQITLLRRASGNPINPNISVFNGRLRE